MISSEQVRQWALEAGFLACGITDLAPNAHGDALDRWLAAGYGGTMRYIHRQAKKRKQPALADSDAKTAIVVLDNYYYDDRNQNGQPPRIAKYARGRDYHETIGARLEALAERLRGAGAGHTRCYVDAGPLPERELARRAGLGWIGKNAMLIRPGVGSFFFIGEILTDLALEPDAPFATDHCGSCTRCLDACPTDAFVEPRVLDATRCISYLTIEQKGPIPDELAGRLNGWAFGCDICNDVCPWNVRFAGQQGEQGEQVMLHDIEQMTEEEFQHRFAGTPFSRPGLSGMKRNLNAALSHSS
jgi:epoxyqueuosine reductase